MNIAIELQDNILLSQTYNNLGNLELLKNNIPEAINYYNLCLQYLRQTNDELGLAQVLANLGNIVALKNPVRSIDYYREALLLAEKIEKKDLISQLSSSLYKAYLSIPDYKMALEYLEKEKQIEKELLNLESSKIVNSLKIQYQTEKKEKENIILKQKSERQKLIRNVFIILIILLIVVAFLFYKRYREKHFHNLQISEKNTLLEAQKQVIEEKNHDITESINYAKKIQDSLLAHEELLQKNFPDSFIYFQPCSIVSGDFYWIKQQEHYLYLVAADCTGHGVPGAFMSVLGISLLNEITSSEKIESPGDILFQLRNRVKESLHQEKSTSATKDGMDISFCLINLENLEMQFAGAYNSMYFFRHTDFSEYKADRMPIGIHPLDNKEFTNYKIQLAKGDTFYLFSDGYVSQFGGPDGGKYKSKRFQQLLTDINSKSLKEQKEILTNEHFQWRGELEQVDDMLVIGVRV